MAETARTIVVTLPPELAAQLDSALLEERQSEGELLEEALASYLRDRGWRRMLRESAAIAADHRITPQDVERLVDEYRDEAGA